MEYLNIRIGQGKWPIKKKNESQKSLVKVHIYIRVRFEIMQKSLFCHHTTFILFPSTLKNNIKLNSIYNTKERKYKRNSEFNKQKYTKNGIEGNVLHITWITNTSHR